MKLKHLALFTSTAFVSLCLAAPVSLSVDATVPAKPISPYIYGKNHGISQKTGVATHADTIQRYRDAGYKMLRMNNGNNATKYHWERKLSSHPDWYNNVYDVDWDQSATEISSRLPGTQGLFALSLLGWAANNKTHNFNDWLYNGSAWWSGTTNNWAGTTPITTTGQVPTGAPDPELYLERRTPTQTVGILDHWFGSGASQLDLDSTAFRYWNMDNEADIWDGTHDDVMPDTMSAEEFIEKYVEMALLARAKFPGIKLVGPVLTNEWQWYTWQNELIPSGGRDYTLIEYFIKRISEEQTRTGKRLLDVVDLHFYPGYDNVTDKANILQVHRIWFDTTYAFPKANGLKMINGGWDVTQNKEYIFQRIRNWLNTYMGQNHGVTLGITECGAIDGVKNDASAMITWYASHLGEFASAGDVEVFTPWSLYDGMFETIHLFTQYAKAQSLPAKNSTDHLVSIYPSISADKDSLTLMVVNRNLSTEQQVTIDLSGFAHGGTWAPTFDLAYVSGETFRSLTQNAVYANAVDLSANSLTITVPKTSVTAIVLSTANPGTKPTFTARVVPSSSSTTPSSSGTNSSSASGTVVWNSAMGAQVRIPAGTMGGWWYNYADELSTITPISASDISTRQSMFVDFDGVQSAEQPWNYAGVGFNWGNTPAGQNIQTINLSAYTGICIDYASTVGIRVAIGQPDPTDATKNKNYLSDGALLPASATRTNVCLPWNSFPAGAELDLTKQSSFQMQVGETAEFTIWQISLQSSTSSIHSIQAMQSNHFTVKSRPNSLELTLKQSADQIQLFNIQGHLVRQWSTMGKTGTHTLQLDQLPKGLYILRVGALGSQRIMR